MVDRPTRVAAIAILITTTTFVTIVCWLHVVRPDLDPTRSGVSRYAVGNHGYTITVAFALLSLATLVAASQIDNGFRWALCTASAGLLLVVFFPLRTSLPGGVAYLLHQVGGAVFFAAGTVGIQAISGKLRAASTAAPLQKTARVSTALAAVAVVPFFTSVAARGSSLNAAAGVFQRVCLAAICTALVTLGLALLRETRFTRDGPEHRS